MIKPVLDTVAELKRYLFMVPGIVDKIQRKDNNTIEVLTGWLSQLETFLQKCGYAQCAELAGLRSKLFTPDFSKTARSSIKKEKLRIASEIIFDAQGIVVKLILPMEDKVNEARAIINQILLVAKPAGILEYDKPTDFNNFIQGIWLMFKTNDHVGGGVSKVLTLVNQSDAVRLLAEEIDFT